MRPDRRPGGRARKAPRTVELRDALPISGAGEILERELRAELWPADDHAVS